MVRIFKKTSSILFILALANQTAIAKSSKKFEDQNTYNGTANPSIQILADFAPKSPKTKQWHFFHLGLLGATSGKLTGFGLGVGVSHIGGGGGKGLQLSMGWNKVDSSFSGVQFTYGLNQVKTTMTGVQLSLLANTAGKELSGIQFGILGNYVESAHLGLQVGSINYSEGAYNGLQFGFVNGARGRFTGIQFSGLNIVTEQVKGIQAGVFYNQSAGFQGIQSGLLSSNTLQGIGLQLSGVNYNHGNFYGVQGALFVNMNTKSLYGLQSSILNLAETLYGLQLGIVNVATQINGTQFGLININQDSRGPTIGIINYSQSGILSMSLGVDSFLKPRLTLRSGSNAIYTMFSYVSSEIYQFSEKIDVIWGLGIGTRFQLAPDSEIKLELENIYYRSNLYSNPNTSAQLRALYATKLSGKIFANIGMTVDASGNGSVSIARELDSFEGLLIAVDRTRKPQIWLGMMAALEYQFNYSPAP